MAFNVAKIASARASLTISLTKSLRVAGPLEPYRSKSFLFLERQPLYQVTAVKCAVVPVQRKHFNATKTFQMLVPPTGSSILCRRPQLVA